MKIVGIMLVRDEDRFVEWAIRNAIDFCDEFHVCDHESQDETPVILGRLAGEYGAKLRIRRCRDSGESHRMIQSYAGTATWVFGVDGDEIYDPQALRRMRARMESGEFDRWWAIFGNVLNVTRLGVDDADGHLAPPCRSMTKLYNFAAIEDWSGRIVERLHGGRIAFKPGFDEQLRLNLHDRSSWGESDFRCLHLCFLSRSSRDAGMDKPRRNIMDRHAWSAGKLLARLRGQPDWKEQKYRRGPLVTESIAAFRPSAT